jgi:chemotaxis protein histidine kinase CheA
VTRLDPTLLGLYVDEALGRVASIVAALTVSPAPDDATLDWVALPTHSLKGLTSQAGDVHLTEEVHSIETALGDLRRTSDPDSRAGPTSAVVERLRAIERELQARVAPAARLIDLRQIADAVAAEVSRVASRQGIPVGVDVVVPEGVTISRRVGGVLIDALGHVARNAVVHGIPRGGTVRVVFSREPKAIVVVVSDHGSPRGAGAPIERSSDLDSGRGVGLQAAHGRLMAVGGELSLSSGAWGGTSVTIRVPT